jgi:hypothetical protein|nr:MAG TPA: Protein of unknown function (DUF1366) [Caudoviricetes sp.]
MFKLAWKNGFELGVDNPKTRVQITNEDMTIIITKNLDGDFSNKSDYELVNLVLEKFYQDTFPNRAENERFSKVDEKLKQLDIKLVELDKLKKELEITQGSLMDLITQMSGSLEDEHHEDNSQPKNSSEGGDSNDGNAIRN